MASPSAIQTLILSGLFAGLTGSVLARDYFVSQQEKTQTLAAIDANIASAEKTRSMTAGGPNGTGGFGAATVADLRRKRQQVAAMPVQSQGQAGSGSNTGGNYHGPGLSPEAIREIQKNLEDHSRREAERAEKEIAQAREYYSGERDRIGAAMSAANDSIEAKLAAIEGGGSSRPRSDDGPSLAEVQADIAKRAEYSNLRNDVVTSLEGSMQNASDSNFLDPGTPSTDPVLDSLSSTESPADYAMADPGKFDPGQNTTDYPETAELPVDGGTAVVQKGDIPADAGPEATIGDPSQAAPSDTQPGEPTPDGTGNSNDPSSPQAQPTDSQQSAPDQNTPPQDAAPAPAETGDPALAGQPEKPPEPPAPSGQEQPPPSDEVADNSANPPDTAATDPGTQAPIEAPSSADATAQQPEPAVAQQTEPATQDAPAADTPSADPTNTTAAYGTPEGNKSPDPASTATTEPNASIGQTAQTDTPAESSPTTQAAQTDIAPPAPPSQTETDPSTTTSTTATPTDKATAIATAQESAAPQAQDTSVSQPASADTLAKNETSTDVSPSEPATSFKDLPAREQTEINRQTDQGFYEKHPEMQGQKIDPSTQSEYAAEWKKDREEILAQRADEPRPLTPSQQTEVNRATDAEFRADHGWKDDQMIDPKTQPELAAEWNRRQEGKEEMMRARIEADAQWEKTKPLYESTPDANSSTEFKDLSPTQQTEVNRQTDEGFYAKHAEMQGQKIDPSIQPEYAVEWKKDREEILAQRGTETSSATESDTSNSSQYSKHWYDPGDKSNRPDVPDDQKKIYVVNNNVLERTSVADAKANRLIDSNEKIGDMTEYSVREDQFKNKIDTSNRGENRQDRIDQTDYPDGKVMPSTTRPQVDGKPIQSNTGQEPQKPSQANSKPSTGSTQDPGSSGSQEIPPNSNQSNPNQDSSQNVPPNSSAPADGQTSQTLPDDIPPSRDRETTDQKEPAPIVPKDSRSGGSAQVPNTPSTGNPTIPPNSGNGNAVPGSQSNRPNIPQPQQQDPDPSGSFFPPSTTKPRDPEPPNSSPKDPPNFNQRPPDSRESSPEPPLLPPLSSAPPRESEPKPIFPDWNRKWEDFKKDRANEWERITGFPTKTWNKIKKRWEDLKNPLNGIEEYIPKYRETERPQDPPYRPAPPQSSNPPPPRSNKTKIGMLQKVSGICPNCHRAVDFGTSPPSCPHCYIEFEYSLF